jgi:hypothetical protein
VLGLLSGTLTIKFTIRCSFIVGRVSGGVTIQEERLEKLNNAGENLDPRVFSFGNSKTTEWARSTCS